MQLENALKISGWMSLPELTWLATQASTHTRIVEVGSWFGRSTRALADNTKGMVYAVDTWSQSSPTTSAYHLGDKPKGWLLNEFLTNTKGLTNIQVVQMLSVDAARSFNSTPQFDMIFIDANHDSVKADILAWKPLLISGGLLCGHDYTDYAAVRQVVDELLPGRAVAVDSIWAITC
jgi:predicted O-methyltransferase YrrM